MTPQELSFVTAISTSCLISFLIPQCNSIGFLQSYFQPNFQSLEERIESAMASNHNNSSGGVFPYSGPRMKSLLEEQDDLFTSVPFYKFLQQGLGAYLASGMALRFVSNESTRRGLLKTEVSLRACADLLRLLAMAICPNTPSVNREQTAANAINDEQKGIMNLLPGSTLPYAFHLIYADRFRLVQLCAEDLVVPECTGERSSDNLKGKQTNRENEKFVFNAAIQQLRDSLFAFASYTAQSDQDACVAYKAVVNIVVREGSLSNIQYEFKRLVDVLLNSSSQIIANTLSDCLSDLVSRFNGSRYYADGLFTRNALILLGDTIHERVVAGTKRNEEQGDEGGERSEKRQRKVVCKPYHFISLLNVARSLFYFLLDTEALMKMESSTNEETLVCLKTEEQVKLQLFRDASLLLHYPLDISVAKAASEFLGIAIAYDKVYLDDVSNTKHLFMCTKNALHHWSLKDRNGTASSTEELGSASALKAIIYTASRKSEAYAFNVFSFAIKTKPQSFWYLVSIISSVQPRIASSAIANSNPNDTDVDSGTSIYRIMTSLSSTMAPGSNQLSFDDIRQCSDIGKTGTWLLYRLVRCCFITANFDLARKLLQNHLIQHSSQETSFMWLNSLGKLAAGENALRSNGHLSIPASLEAISSCYSSMLSMASLRYESGKGYEFGHLGRFGFQLEFVRARIEFLQLVKATRFSCTEHVLTSHSFGDTRTKLHLKNLPNCFTMLSSRYIKIYRTYGFHCCQQSRSALRGMISMCQILRDVINLVFFHKHSSIASESDQNVTKSGGPSGDRNHPMGILISRLRSELLPHMRETAGAKDLFDMIDAILKCPVPFPSAFFVVKPIPMVYAEARLHPPDQHLTIIQANGHEMVEVTPGNVKLMISGIIPAAFLESAKLRFSHIIAWPSISYEGRLVEDEDLDDINESVSNGGDESRPLVNITIDAISTEILPEGKFNMLIELGSVIEEGCHRVVIQLGCRDVHCGEWLVPVKKQMGIVVRVVDR